jgi:hypothetical protein
LDCDLKVLNVVGVPAILSLEEIKTQLTDYDVLLPILHQRMRHGAVATSNESSFSQPPVELCKFHIFTRQS